VPGRTLGGGTPITYSKGRCSAVRSGQEHLTARPKFGGLSGAGARVYSLTRAHQTRAVGAGKPMPKHADAVAVWPDDRIVRA
jgi:hypothetical protein